MTMVRNVGEAKAQLSHLLDAAVRGDEVVIARAGKPLVRLVPVKAPAKRTLGFLALDAPDEAFAPLSDDDLDAWE